MFAKRRILAFGTALLATVAHQHVSAADVSVIAGPGDQDIFQPADVQINVGDTVVWSFATFHSVVSSDGPRSCTPGGAGFNSGQGSGTPFSYTFTTPGVYYYFCDVGPHCANGMVGSVTVNAGPGGAGAGAGETQPSTSADGQNSELAAPSEIPAVTAGDTPTADPNTNADPPAPTNAPAAVASARTAAATARSVAATGVASKPATRATPAIATAAANTTSGGIADGGSSAKYMSTGAALIAALVAGIVFV
ncbi:hypothetical protein HK102_006215 [Quaeritorhiza haematococci]|nr:hypothetical protein HK102_006215 [Quaeritorhiza haematococci]